MKNNTRFQQLTLPFYILKLTMRLSPAYLVATMCVSLATAVQAILNVWLTQQILAGLLSGMERRALLGLAVATAVANLLLHGVRRILLARQEVLAARFRDDFKCYVGDRIISMDYARLEDPAVMDLKEQALRPIIDYGVLKLMLEDTIPSILGGVFMLCGTAVIAVGSFPVLLLVTLALTALNLLLMNRTRQIRNNAYKTLFPVERRITVYNGMAADYSMGKDVRLYGMDGMIMDKIRRLNREDLKVVTAQNNQTSRSVGLSALAFQGQLFVVYGFLALLAMRGGLTIADYTFYTGIFLNLGNALFKITDKLSEVFYTGRFFSAFREFEAIPVQPAAGADIQGNEPPAVEFKNVSFRYPRAEAPVLENLSLTLNKGERVALVGRNGAGKTTLVKLLCGLYQPEQGELLFDGRAEKGLLGKASTVFQDFKLFAFTIYDNVVMGKEKDADIIPLLEQVGLRDTLAALPERERTYLYKIFEKTGTELSGGNSQRLAIARAIYRNAPLLILDEPTAALDPVAEEEIFRCFQEISRGKTALMISHRLSATRFCDRILVLQDGRIAEDGSHEELMGMENGIYREMYETQAQYYREQKERELAG